MFVPSVHIALLRRPARRWAADHGELDDVVLGATGESGRRRQQLGASISLLALLVCIAAIVLPFTGWPTPRPHCGTWKTGTREARSSSPSPDEQRCHDHPGDDLTLG
jgi:hypothetical protein